MMEVKVDNLDVGYNNITKFKKNDLRKLIRMPSTPTSKDLENVNENQYIITSDSISYYQCKTKRLIPLQIKEGRTFDELSKRLNLTEERDASIHDIETINLRIIDKIPSEYFEQELPKDSRYKSTEDWQFRISVNPTEENLEKAVRVLKDFFANHPQDPSFWVKCLALPGIDGESAQRVLKDWDPQYLTGTDRDQRGREICIYMHLKDILTEKYIKTPDQWKHLMLSLWSELQNNGVELGYVPVISGDKAVPSEQTLLTPFSYTSFKPYEQRHKILHETHYNPLELTDPLEDMNPITWDDLEYYTINHEKVEQGMEYRNNYTSKHIIDMNQAIKNKLQEISDKDEYSDKEAPVSSTADKPIENGIPLSDKEQIKSEISELKFEFTALRVRQYLESLELGDLDINNCIDKAPREMQKVYRGIVHAIHEQIALENDLKHLNGQELLPFDKIQPVEGQIVEELAQPEQSNIWEIFKDIAISSGILLTSTGIGAGIGALLGSFAFGIGAVPGALIGGFFGGSIGLITTGLQGMIRNRFSGGEFVTQEKAAAGIFATVGSTTLGALIGTIIAPGIGTLIGAGIGLVIGAVGSGVVSWASSPKEVEKVPVDQPDVSINNPYSHSSLKKDSSNNMALTTKAGSNNTVTNKYRRLPISASIDQESENKDKNQAQDQGNGMII